MDGHSSCDDSMAMIGTNSDSEGKYPMHEMSLFWTCLGET